MDWLPCSISVGNNLRLVFTILLTAQGCVLILCVDLDKIYEFGDILSSVVLVSAMCDHYVLLITVLVMFESGISVWRQGCLGCWLFDKCSVLYLLTITQLGLYYLYIVDHCLQNRLLAMNYINEGHDDKLFEAHRFQLNPFCFSCI